MRKESDFFPSGFQDTGAFVESFFPNVLYLETSLTAGKVAFIFCNIASGFKVILVKVLLFGCLIKFELNVLKNENFELDNI